MKNVIRITTLALAIFGTAQAHAAHMSNVKSVECDSA